jgi:hypothetical protein
MGWQYVSIFALVTFIYFESCGGNMLMDVGPTTDGRIIPMFEERLRKLGSLTYVHQHVSTTTFKINKCFIL